MKKIIFFDGDGTLWYPKSTKRTKEPHWIYKNNRTPKDYLPLLTLTPALISVLGKLKKRGVILIALSTHPHSVKEANEHMSTKAKHFGIDYLFDHIYTSRPYPWGKGKAMLSVLKKNKIPKSRALLIGDSYLYDYLSAKSVGIDCWLIKTKYTKYPPKGRKVQKTIVHLKELLSKLD